MVDDMLAGMSRSDMLLLQDRLAYAMKKTSRDPITTAEQMIWDAVCDACGLRDRARPPIAQAMDKIGRGKFNEYIVVLNDFVAAGSGGANLRRPVHQAILTTVLRCLVQRLRHRGISLSPRTVLMNLSQLSIAVEQRFPGYVEAHLLHRVAPIAIAA